MSKKEEADKKKAEEKRRDYEFNHRKIRIAYVDLIKNHGRCPTIGEVAQYSSLSFSTCQRHLENISFETEQHPLRVLTEDVLLAIYQSALEGGAAAQKLWMQLMEGWSEKTILDHQSKGERIGDVNVMVKGSKSKLLQFNEN